MSNKEQRVEQVEAILGKFCDGEINKKLLKDVKLCGRIAEYQMSTLPILSSVLMMINAKNE